MAWVRGHALPWTENSRWEEESEKGFFGEEGEGGLACPPLDMLYKNSVLHVNQL